MLHGIHWAFNSLDLPSFLGVWVAIILEGTMVTRVNWLWLGPICLRLSLRFPNFAFLCNETILYNLIYVFLYRVISQRIHWFLHQRPKIPPLPKWLQNHLTATKKILEKLVLLVLQWQLKYQKKLKIVRNLNRVVMGWVYSKIWVKNWKFSQNFHKNGPQSTNKSVIPDLIPRKTTWSITII